MNDLRIGLEIQAINNGYLVTGHKTNGFMGADTGKTFFANFDDLSAALTSEVRKSFDLALEAPSPDVFSGYGDGYDVAIGGLN